MEAREPSGEPDSMPRLATGVLLGEVVDIIWVNGEEDTICIKEATAHASICI